MGCWREKFRLCNGLFRRFFDQLYILEEDGSDQYINMYVPDNTNLYFDAMVIPTTSKNPDLAYEFINFMLDTDNIVENVSYVGYCPCTKASIEALKMMNIIHNY